MYTVRSQCVFVMLWFLGTFCSGYHVSKIPKLLSWHRCALYFASIHINNSWATSSTVCEKVLSLLLWCRTHHVVAMDRRARVSRFGFQSSTRRISLTNFPRRHGECCLRGAWWSLSQWSLSSFMRKCAMQTCVHWPFFLFFFECHVVVAVFHTGRIFTRKTRQN